jgi:hypothetical protein
MNQSNVLECVPDGILRRACKLHPWWCSMDVPIKLFFDSCKGDLESSPNEINRLAGPFEDFAENVVPKIITVSLDMLEPLGL